MDGLGNCVKNGIQGIGVKELNCSWRDGRFIMRTMWEAVGRVRVFGGLLMIEGDTSSN